MECGCGCKGAARGGNRERPPPEIEKNCCRKMVLFPKVLFLATTFPKLTKISIFLLNFYQQFSQNFQTMSVSSQTREKVTHDLINSYENMQT